MAKPRRESRLLHLHIVPPQASYHDDPSDDANFDGQASSAIASPPEYASMFEYLRDRAKRFPNLPVPEFGYTQPAVGDTSDPSHQEPYRDDPCIVEIDPPPPAYEAIPAPPQVEQLDGWEDVDSDTHTAEEFLKWMPGQTTSGWKIKDDIKAYHGETLGLRLLNMAVATVTIASGATWQEVAKDRQRHRDETIAAIEPAIPDVASIPQNTTSVAKGLLTVKEIEITETTVETLTGKLSTGELTALEVTQAFLRRAGLAQKLVNCIAELLPERAIARAKYLDEFRKTHGKTVGPLHGVPISVKEHIGFKDLDHNAAFIAWVGRVGKEDAHILQLLWRAGAVFYCRTTQPQSLMHLETSSNIYGVTVNPFNTTLTSGGSSGGEGALIGFRGSCLGIGTDIGGSIRSPAANNGLYGFKPTARRLPMAGLAATMDGQEHILPTIGPLSTSLEGCKIFTKSLIDAKPWYKESFLLPFPWKEEKAFKDKKLKVAILWDDGVVKPHPPVTRALKQIVEKLKAKGNVEVVDWKPYQHDRAWEIIANLYFCDGGDEEKAAIAASGEPMRPLTEFIITENPHLEKHTIPSLWSATVTRDKYRDEYAELWSKTATHIGPNGEPQGIVDVILCPVGPGSAPKIDTAKYWGYTCQWNLLDYPAFVFPVDKVDVEKDGGKEEYSPRNPKDEYNWKLWEEHGAEGYKDAPISLQLVGRRFEDEKVIEALELIKEETGFPFVNYV
ncbi:hypothetical protein B7463_g10752, partial [Scytalidium lignicola]